MLEAFFNHYTTASEIKALSTHIFSKMQDPAFAQAVIDTMSLALFDPDKRSEDQITLKEYIISSTNDPAQPYVPITQEALELLKTLRNELGEDAFYDLVDADKSAEANWPKLAKQIQEELAKIGLRIQDFSLCEKPEDYIPTEAALAKLAYDFGVVK